MSVFAPEEAMSDSGNHPPLEELAAYIDGLLSEEEAARVAEHISECEDCFFVYSETVRFQLEAESKEEAVSPEGRVVPFSPKEEAVLPKGRAALFSSRKRAAWMLGSIAALLLVGLGFGLFTLFAPPPELRTAELVAPLRDDSGLGPVLWRGKTDRGGNGDPKPEDWEDLLKAERVPGERAFQIGVQLVNLQVSLETNDEGGSLDALPRLITLLNEEILLDDQNKFYKELVTSIDDQSPRTFAEEGAEKAEEVRDLFFDEDKIYLDFGQWTEAGRLSAISKEPSFFEQGQARSFLRSLLRQQKAGKIEIGPPALNSLEEIAKHFRATDLQDSDYAEFRRDFEGILQHYYPQYSEQGLLRPALGSSDHLLQPLPGFKKTP